MNLPDDYASFAETAENILIRKGYDTTCVHRISFDGTEFSLGISHEDDFQTTIPSTDRVAHEWHATFRATTPSELLAKLSALPSREQRELRVMARRLAELDGMKGQLASLFARDFVAGLTQPLADLRAMIEDQSVG